MELTLGSLKGSIAHFTGEMIFALLAMGATEDLAKKRLKNGFWSNFRPEYGI